ncbi:carboxyl-terminal protease [Carbonactinospora thermoautotrophica]|nr:carboxyl-terminal protease [Carbonactinospora thermoautotrophica]
MSTISGSGRRLRRGAAIVTAVAFAYGGGVVTGILGSENPPPPRRQPETGLLDEAAQRIAAEAARPVDRQQLERAAVEGMLRALGDKWSAFYQPSEFDGYASALEGHYSGVGLWLRRSPQGRIRVASVQPGSPAAGVRIAAGDELVSVAGRPVAGRTVEDVVSALRGPVGSKVQIVFARHDRRYTATLTRTMMSTDDVTVQRLRGVGGAPVTKIRIASFTRGVGQEVRQALAEHPEQHRGGVVLDLRDNPGGLLDEAVDVTSAFLNGGPVVSYQSRADGSRTLYARPGGDRTTRIVVLVNGGTASAAEIVAAALQDHHRALVIGSRTFGKGSVQEPSRLSDGSAIQLTVGWYRTPKGRYIDGVGVEPDIPVDTTDPKVAEQRALEVLRGLLASLGGDTKGRG